MMDVSITVSRSLGVPLVTQIRDQVSHAIRAGDLRAGDRLPTIRQLAGFLGINRNTVAQAYRLLENDGYIITRAGGGTTVASAQASGRAPAPATLRDLVLEALRGAESAGFSAREFADLADLEATRQETAPVSRILVIDGYRGELDFVCSAIQRALPNSTVEALLVADLYALDPAELRLRVASFDCALVAFYCLETVRPVLDIARIPVVAAGIGPSLGTLRRIADECAGKKAAIVCTEPNGPEHMEAALRLAGIEFAVGPLHAHTRQDTLAETLTACDVIIASHASAGIVGRLAGGKPVITYSRLISEETLATLRSYTDYLAVHAAPGIRADA